MLVEGLSNVLLRQFLHSANSLLPRVSLLNSFSIKKKLISPNFAIFYTCKCIFGNRQTTWQHGPVPQKKGGIQGLAGLAPCSQAVGSLRRVYIGDVQHNIVHDYACDIVLYILTLAVKSHRVAKAITIVTVACRCH